MGSTTKVKRKSDQSGGSVAGDEALRREARADRLFSPRQGEVVDARRPTKKLPKQPIKQSTR